MSLHDKADYTRQLAALKRRMKKVVDWACNTAELERDDLILDLCQLAQKAIDSLPNGGDAVIRWQPEDIQEKAADMGMRLSRGAAKEVLHNIGRSLEDSSISHGWDVIQDRLYEKKAARRQAKREAV